MISEIQKLPSAPLRSRGNIPVQVVRHYGVKVEFSESTGEEVAYYFPRTKKGKVTGYHKRTLPKTFSNVGDTRGSELFGQSVCGDGGKFIVLCESSEDTLAAKTMLLRDKKKWRVAGLPNGANSRAVKDNLQWLEKFDTVVLAMDQDEAGHKVSEEISRLLSPGKAKIATWENYKDVNDIFLSKKDQVFISALWKAQETAPDGVVSVGDIYDRAISPVEPGKPWPWPSLTKATYGRRRKEMYGLGGGTGAGKTEVFKQIIKHVITEDDLPVGLMFLEEDPAHTAKVIAGKIYDKRFHVPGTGWTPEELEKAIKSLDGKLFFYDHWGQKDWDGIKGLIRYMVVSLGIKDIFLDHLTALAAGQDDVNRYLEDIMSEMAALTQELDFTLYFISHLATPTGVSHEEGGRVTVSQFRGSRAIAFWSHFLFGLERDQQSDDEEERHTVTFRVLKDRYTGEGTGRTFQIQYSHETGNIEEVKHEF